MNAGAPLRQHLATLWQARTPRERRLLGTGAAVLLLAWLWRGLLAPAWQTWQEAPSRQASLQQQTQHMLQLQAQAGQLQSQRRLERPQALALLQSSASQLLGPEVQLSPQGQDLHVRLKAAPARGLAQWLAQAREQAQTRPRLAQLQKQTGAASPDNSQTTWSGTLVLRLP